MKATGHGQYENSHIRMSNLQGVNSFGSAAVLV